MRRKRWGPLLVSASSNLRCYCLTFLRRVCFGSRQPWANVLVRNYFCRIPLPPWVHEAIDRDNDIVYTDKSGRRNREYLSLSVDHLPVLHGRTPIQAYSDFMRSFRENFLEFLGSVISVSFLETSAAIAVASVPCGRRGFLQFPYWCTQRCCYCLQLAGSTSWHGACWRTQISVLS